MSPLSVLLRLFRKKIRFRRDISKDGTIFGKQQAGITHPWMTKNYKKGHRFETFYLEAQKMFIKVIADQHY